MAITDDDINAFKERMKDQFNVEMSFEEAKHRYLELMDLFWILGHKPQEDGEPPYDPPLPPWRY